MNLVIGYGNELRRDDGIGPFLARVVGSWGLPNWRTLAVHQLVPELIEEIAQANRVIFVDAGIQETELEIKEILPAQSAPGMGHTGSPESLLALCRALHGIAPNACQITVGVEDLSFGEGFSQKMLTGAQEALMALQQKIEAA